MAGSWKHIVDDEGRLLSNKERQRQTREQVDPWSHPLPSYVTWNGSRFTDMIENLGDAYEAIEECYGMVMYLTGGDRAKIEEARQHYRDGLAIEPHGEGGTE